jgi:hypothetical protein
MDRLLKYPVRFAIIFALVLIIFCFIWIFLLSRPAFIPGFNLTGKDQIGETIGGITAPIVGIGTSVLLFLALMFQIKAMDTQRVAFDEQDLKNESDFIFVMFNQFLTELSFFSYNYDQNTPINPVVNINLSGVTALNMFVIKYSTTSMKNKGIGEFPPSRQILLLLETLRSIKNRIGIAKITELNRSMYQAKLESYYTNYLKANLESLEKTFTSFPTSADQIADKIREFYASWQN